MNLPQAFIGRIAHAVKRAEQEASKGHLRWIQHIAPNVDPNIVQNVYKSIGETEGAKRAVDDAVKAEAARASEAEAKAAPRPMHRGHLHQKLCQRAPQSLEFFLIRSAWSC